jgi:heat shock 70kDa protein 4
MEKLAGEFDKKHKNDPMENVRCKLRIMEACEKARKVLTADTEANIGVDYLLDEQDLNRNIKRDEMEEIIKPFTDRFAMVCREAIELSKLNLADIESVELLGDCTRTPIITEILKEVF